MTQITREYLETLTLKQVKFLDIKSKEDETLIQEYLNEKTVGVIPQIKLDPLKVPDIKNPEMEAEWQAKVDEFYTKLKPIEVQIKEAEVELASLTDFIPEVNVEQAPEAPTSPVEVVKEEETILPSSTTTKKINKKK